MRDALRTTKISPEVIQLVPSEDRATTKALLTARGKVDLVAFVLSETQLPCDPGGRRDGLVEQFTDLHSLQEVRVRQVQQDLLDQLRRARELLDEHRCVSRPAMLRMYASQDALMSRFLQAQFVLRNIHEAASRGGGCSLVLLLLLLLLRWWCWCWWCCWGWWCWWG